MSRGMDVAAGFGPPAGRLKPVATSIRPRVVPRRKRGTFAPDTISERAPSGTCSVAEVDRGSAAFTMYFSATGRDVFRKYGSARATIPLQAKNSIRNATAITEGTVSRNAGIPN